MLKPMMKVQKQQALTNSLDDKDKHEFLHGKIGSAAGSGRGMFQAIYGTSYQGNKLIKVNLKWEGKAGKSKNLDAFA